MPKSLNRCGVALATVELAPDCVQTDDSCHCSGQPVHYQKPIRAYIQRRTADEAMMERRQDGLVDMTELTSSDERPLGIELFRDFR